MPESLAIRDRLIHRLTPGFLFVAFFFAGHAAAFAQPKQQPKAEPPAAPDLPKAASILDRYIEVTGGQAAYERLKSRVSTGTAEIVAAGVRGTVTISQAAPDKMRTVIDLAGLGVIEGGSEGKIAWDNSAMTGPRVKEGVERMAALRDSVFNSEIKWRELYKAVETASLEEINGKPAYKVQVTHAEGKPEYHYYEKESGLLVKRVLTLQSHMGDLPVELYFDDYKAVDGVKVPHKLTQKMGPQTIMFTLTKIEQNTPVAADRFDPPEGVKALIEKAKIKPMDSKPAVPENEKPRELG